MSERMTRSKAKAQAQALAASAGVAQGLGAGEGAGGGGGQVGAGAAPPAIAAVAPLEKRKPTLKAAKAPALVNKIPPSVSSSSKTSKLHSGASKIQVEPRASSSSSPTHVKEEDESDEEVLERELGDLEEESDELGEEEVDKLEGEVDELDDDEPVIDQAAPAEEHDEQAAAPPAQSKRVSTGQPKIASFAPELIDEILHHLAVDEIEPDDSPEDFNPGPKAIADLALISQNWRGPVQRRLMSRIFIKSGTHAKRVAEGLVASDFGVYIKDLTILFTEGILIEGDGFDGDDFAEYVDEPTFAEITAADSVSRDHFLALLPLFPALTSLTLCEPPFSHFGTTDIPLLKASPIFPRLTYLAISSGRWHHDVDLVHDIVCLTPSLTSLTLTSDPSDTSKSPNSKKPITLPFLKTLELLGGTYPTSFINLNLLATRTITQIEYLYCDDGDCLKLSANPLLQTMGLTLKRLGYSTWNEEDRDMAVEFHSCTVLEELELYLHEGSYEGLLAHLPPKIHTLTLCDIEDAHELLVDDFKSRSASLKTVRLDCDFCWQDHGPSCEFESERELATGKKLKKALEELQQDHEAE
ncbi:hypothetical protein RQP46_010873 [Phenoliferia psychrophenolica]